jgi:hypothetical protein
MKNLVTSSRHHFWNLEWCDFSQMSEPSCESLRELKWIVRISVLRATVRYVEPRKEFLPHRQLPSWIGDVFRWDCSHVGLYSQSCARKKEQKQMLPITFFVRSRAPDRSLKIRHPSPCIERTNKDNEKQSLKSKDTRCLNSNSVQKKKSSLQLLLRPWIKLFVGGFREKKCHLLDIRVFRISTLSILSTLER